MDSRTTQQCNKVPYHHAVYLLPPAPSPFLMARKCNSLAGIIVMRCAMKYAWAHKFSRVAQLSIPYTVAWFYTSYLKFKKWNSNNRQRGYHYKLGRKIFITALVIASHRCSTHLVFCMTILHISVSIVLGVWLGNVIFKYTLITSENAFICIRLHKIIA